MIDNLGVPVGSNRIATMRISEKILTKMEES
jgi:hypothetical protein